MRFYWGIRRDVSLLLSEGHAWAREYPIAVLWSEARIVRQRNATRVKRDTALMQSAIFSALAKKAGAELAKTLKRIDESE